MKCTKYFKEFLYFHITQQSKKMNLHTWYSVDSSERSQDTNCPDWTEKFSIAIYQFKGPVIGEKQNIRISSQRWCKYYIIRHQP